MRHFKVLLHHFKHPLAVLSAVATIAAIIAFFVSAAKPDYLSITLLSNVIVFIASGLVSYLITHSNDKLQFSEEMGKLADFARRRVDLLSENLNSLIEEISSIHSVEETKRIVSYTLRNLEQDARASVRDIEDMGGIAALAAVEIPSPQSDESRPLLTEATAAPATASELGLVTFNCLNCGHSNSTTLNTATGSTKSVTCSNCLAILNLHRIAGGAYKVVPRDKKRLSTYAAQTSLPPPVTHKADHSHWREEKWFSCPRCQNRITYSEVGDQRIVEKPCFSCLSVVSYDRAEMAARINPVKHPIFVDSIDLEEMNCVTCGANFKAKKFQTQSGNEIVCCFRCNSIYISKENRKSRIEKQCPTEGCGNPVTFKISPAQDEARQFCFECMNRLVYKKAEDRVEVVEHLSVPCISTAQFRHDGQLCPHCNQATSARTTRNTRGQSFCICWNCKNVFELKNSIQQA